MTRALVITGPFHDCDLELFAKLLRHIERSRPDQTFTLAIDDVDSQGYEDAIRLLASIFPRREEPKQ